MLEVMVDVEDAQSVLDAATNTLEQVNAEVASENKDLLFEKAKLESEVSQLQKKRSTAVNAVNETNLKLYDTLRPQKANQPIAKLERDDTCSACGIRQMGIFAKEVRQSEEIHYCKNCKRVLVVL
jgi:predicted  nucleic acid-binding Zn-ribbon protein